MPSSNTRRNKRASLRACSVKDVLQTTGVDLELVGTIREALAVALDAVIPKHLESWSLLEKASVREALRMQLATLTDVTVADARGSDQRMRLDNPWVNPDRKVHFA